MTFIMTGHFDGLFFATEYSFKLLPCFDYFFSVHLLFCRQLPIRAL